MSARWLRQILFGDIDAMFASAAVLADPSLKGKPVAVVLLQLVWLKEHGRQPDASSSGRLLGGARKRLPRSDPADKHSGGGSQPTAPFDGNRG